MTVGRWVIWMPGLAVAIGSAVATAHGLYEVAVAAAVPAAIAWLYPLITDGLALVAYAATARLRAGAARYAWSVVVLAAGLSGLAQAAYLAAGSAIAGTSGVAAPGALRFGVGAWPAVAAAIVAHLLYLLATGEPQADDGAASEPPEEASRSGRAEVAAAELFSAGDREHGDPTVQPFNGPAGVQPPHSPSAPPVRPAAAPTGHPRPRSDASPARDRARSAAVQHATHHGHLPTVSELQAAAAVSRGTAAAVLKALRAQPPGLHLITNTPEPDPSADDDAIEETNQP